MARPDIDESELELVTEVLRSDVLSMGTFAPRFETELAAIAGRRHRCLVSMRPCASI
jgi:dTDP-4-amino-4,6-dideoxygalactose transaminase